MNKIKKSAILFAAGVSLMCNVLFVACDKENTELSCLYNH